MCAVSYTHLDVYKRQILNTQKKQLNYIKCTQPLKSSKTFVQVIVNYTDVTVISLGTNLYSSTRWYKATSLITTNYLHTVMAQCGFKKNVMSRFIGTDVIPSDETS